MATLENHSSKAVREFIETYLDPQATIKSTDDPVALLDALDATFQAQDEDNFVTGLYVSDVRAYLAYLATIGR